MKAKASYTPFHELDEQPMLIKGGLMKEYQLHGLSYLANMHLNGTLARFNFVGLVVTFCHLRDEFYSRRRVSFGGRPSIAPIDDLQSVGWAWARLFKRCHYSHGFVRTSQVQIYIAFLSNRID